MVSKSAIIPRLVIIEGKDKGKVITLTDGTAVIGRSKGDVLIQDARISRSHIAIHFDSRTGKLSFTDLKSLNGTIVNGVTAESGELHDGDKLAIGNTHFDCQITVAGEEPTSTSEILARTKEREKARTAPKPQAPSPTPVFAETPLSASLIPLEESSIHGKEPVAMSSPVKTDKAHQWHIPNLGTVRAAYLKVPTKARTLLLVFIAGLCALHFLGKPSKPGSSNTKVTSFEKEVAVVRTLAESGKLDEALARVQEMKVKYANSSDPYMLAGDIYSVQGKNPLAIESFTKAHGMLPEQPLVHIKMIRVLLRSGLTREAGEELQHVEKIINERKFSRELFVEAAQLFLEFKELKQAPEKTLILARALQKEYAPDSSIGYKLEAQLHFQENRPKEALDAMDKGRVIDPQDEWLIENSVFAKLALKDYGGAETLLNDWLKLRPAATKALLVLGYLRYNDKAYVKALPFVQKILQIGNANPTDPYFPEALNLMGQIYTEMGQPQEAAKFFQQGCERGFQQSCEQSLAKAEEAGEAGETGKPAPASLPDADPGTDPGTDAGAPAPPAGGPPVKQPSAAEQIVEPPPANDLPSGPPPSAPVNKQ